MYVVVVFEESNEVELVASNWLNSNKSTYWPPFRSPSSITKAVKDRIAPNQDTWSVYAIRVLCACDTYEHGRQKLRQAEDTSDIQSPDEENVGKGARKRRERRYSTDSDDDCQESPKSLRSETRPPTRTSNIEDLVIPIPPPLFPFDLIPNASVREVSEIDMDPSIDTSQSSPKLPIVQTVPAHTAIAPAQTGSSQAASAHTAFAPAQTGSAQAASTHTAFAPAQTASAQTVSAHTASATQLEILKAVAQTNTVLEDIRQDLKYHRQLLLRLLHRQGDHQQEDSEEHSLPLKTMVELEEMERKLIDKAAKSRLVIQLSSIGGSTVKETVKRTMGQVLAHSLSLKFNWNGKSGWKSSEEEPKRAFAGLQICDAVKRAVRKNTMLSTCDAEVDKEIMVWLRNASDRNGGRKRRWTKARREEQTDN